MFCSFSGAPELDSDDWAVYPASLAVFRSFVGACGAPKASKSCKRFKVDDPIVKIGLGSARTATKTQRVYRLFAKGIMIRSSMRPHSWQPSFALQEHPYPASGRQAGKGGKGMGPELTPPLGTPTPHKQEVRPILGGKGGRGVHLRQGLALAAATALSDLMSTKSVA